MCPDLHVNSFIRKWQKWIALDSKPIKFSIKEKKKIL